MCALSTQNETGIHALTTLPQVSLAKLAAADATQKEERACLRTVCQDHGFFYLVQQGIAKERIIEEIQSSRHFFALPQPVKERCGFGCQVVYPSLARGCSPLHGELLHREPDPDAKISTSIWAIFFRPLATTLQECPAPSRA
ncbi:2-oxoglutarate and iron-dependent oxygenase domain-containing protein [Mesorhizobium sp. L103C131B0]|uniref:2-oxoglutarate and iron-dependent oxygenase domain-containing protein n=1 Tax=Mesorhizobium sp. L103C131B0 TaxID=1287089 RepID=UPI001FD89323|nr:2-oxoglutarate and iron-dependent oxygenase domain-containing protein [Mesorhizobium sp. L103C131B0]